jgi:predicted Zn-dependent protease with MMP-like domain
MTREEFEKIIEQEYERAIPEKFRPHITNVGFLVEDEPDDETRKQEGLGPGQTLLGLYRGIPYPARGDWYGMGSTMPDTITLYQKPIEEEGAHVGDVRKVVRETIWHEVAHLFGMDEHQVRRREDLRDNYAHDH